MTQHSPQLAITYRFLQPGLEAQEMTVRIDESTMRSTPLSDAPYPAWTRMDAGGCEGCEWKESEHCPVAIRLVKPVETFLFVVSFEQLEVEVISADRKYSKKLDMQQGLSSLFGLVMATSGCPSLAAFRPMARFHLPFASFDETFFRVLSSCLMRHFVEGNLPNTSRDQVMAEVTEVYAKAARVNAGLMERLRTGIASMADSSPNAVALLAAFSGLVPLTAEKQVKKIEALFKA